MERLEFERPTCVPTAGVIVKGSLDTCNVCEPELPKKMQLELDRLDLQNQLLKRQTEFLEQDQEHRCCPEGATEEAEDNA